MKKVQDVLKDYETFWKLSDRIETEITLSDDQKRSLHETERIIRQYLTHLYALEDLGGLEASSSIALPPSVSPRSHT